MNPRIPPLFIVFEGIDGSGTSTQAHLLQSYFLGQKMPAAISPEPTNGPIGKMLRAALKSDIFHLQDSTKFDQQMAYLFAGDRHYHLYNKVDGVFFLIQSGIHVITPRYYFSSLAYNCNNLEEYNFVSQLNQRFPNPDLVVYLDIPVQISLSRLREREDLEIYENVDKLQKVRENYLKIFANYPSYLLQIDGTKDKILIHENIKNYLQERFFQSD